MQRDQIAANTIGELGRVDVPLLGEILPIVLSGLLHTVEDAVRAISLLLGLVERCDLPLVILLRRDRLIVGLHHVRRGRAVGWKRLRYIRLRARVEDLGVGDLQAALYSDVPGALHPGLCGAQAVGVLVEVVILP